MSALAFRHADASGSSQSGGRFFTTLFFGAFLIAVTGWVIAYSTGIAPWLGFATQSEVFVGERAAPRGLSIGPRTFAFAKGQRVFVSYDLEKAQTGALEVRVVRRGDLTPDPAATLTLEAVGKGRHIYRVPDSGLYTVALNCMPGAEGCDIAYRATWGGLPADRSLRVAEADAELLGQWIAAE